MNNIVLRPCGGGFAYCRGNCKDCYKTKIITTLEANPVVISKMETATSTFKKEEK